MHAVARRQNQWHVQSIQFALQRHNCVVQPPSACPAKRAEIMIVQYVQSNSISIRHGVDQGRIVGGTKIFLEPMDGDIAHIKKYRSKLPIIKA